MPSRQSGASETKEKQTFYNVDTWKSPVGVRGSLSKVLHFWVRPWKRFSSRKMENLPSSMPTQREELEQRTKRSFLQVHFQTWKSH